MGYAKILRRYAEFIEERGDLKAACSVIDGASSSVYVPSMTEDLLLSVSQVAELANCSVRDVENWVRRLPLKSAVQKVTRGQPRRFSGRNALEIAFISALTKCGLRAQKATQMAGRWLDLEELEVLAPYWVIFDGTADQAHHVGMAMFDWFFKTSDEPPDPDAFTPPPDVLCAAIINIAGIRERVRKAAIFAAAEEINAHRYP